MDEPTGKKLTKREFLDEVERCLDIICNLKSPDDEVKQAIDAILNLGKKIKAGGVER